MRIVCAPPTSHKHAHTRTCTQAFSRQANLLARNVQRGERTVKCKTEASLMSQNVHEVRIGKWRTCCMLLLMLV